MTTKVIRLKIESRSYEAIADQPLYVTPELKKRLEGRKTRDGRTRYERLTAMGFRGGKHLIETLREKYGKSFAIVLTDGPSKLGAKRAEINFDEFLDFGQARFFEVYRQTGLQTAAGYLSQEFPKAFVASTPALPPTRDVKKVLAALPEAAEVLPKKQQRELPQQIADLIDKQGPEFVFSLLSGVDSAIPKGQERIRTAFQQVIARLAKEPAKALDELNDLMDRWNLLQVTSLLNVLQARLQTIETFEQLILDEKTYELREDNSVHRTLERSMWLLDDEYWIAQSNRPLRKMIGDALAKEDRKYRDKRPDFACVDATGRTVIVEIKRPSVSLGKPEVDQAELYFRLIRKHVGSPSKTAKVFLVGGSISEEARELAEMRKYPELLTYQEMIEGCRRRYQEYLRIVESGT
ncbi:MAG: hypothetical protein WD249_06430 [Gaiellaceae bacterium]